MGAGTSSFHYDERPPLPAALVCRGIGRLFRRARSRRDEARRIAVNNCEAAGFPKRSTSVAEAFRILARNARPPALYWLVLTLITFLGMSSVINFAN
jgi:hypothetical protein